MSSPCSPEALATTIRDGFNRHYSLFRAITNGARQRFEQGDWAAVQQASRERIAYYDSRVQETIASLHQQCPQLDHCDDQLWRRVRDHYRHLLLAHPQPELAETFYNSVFCHMFERRYYNNQLIFIESFAEQILEVREGLVADSYYPQLDGLTQTLTRILTRFGLTLPFEDLARDVRRLMRRFIRQAGIRVRRDDSVRIDVLKSMFYRNKGAYIVGRVVTRGHSQPFVIPILRSPRGELYVDALLTAERDLSITFSFARAYFFVETEAPFALVRFLQQLMPAKRSSELYNAIGLQKQGKSIFYRDLLSHLATTEDHFDLAPGVKGMVMLVFTLPSYPYVFKVIRDRFAPSKTMTKAEVRQKYQLVKVHDRVGRMADTLEYSQVAFPKARMSEALLEELYASCSEELIDEGEMLLINHLYIERRMTPLNLYLQQASDAQVDAVIDDYGHALREIAAANIFPGDMLLKNFGVTRFGRVVFYDYDEVAYLLDTHFRVIPAAITEEQELASEPWYSVAPGDVFPEEFETFIFYEPRARAAFRRHHRELYSARWWQQQQQRIRDGHQEEFFPYSSRLRFRRHGNPG